MAVGCAAEVASGLKEGVVAFAEPLTALFFKALRDKEGEAEAEGDIEAERQRLALPVPLAETRGVGEGQCVAPKESDMEGLADWEADAPAVRLGVE